MVDGDVGGESVVENEMNTGRERGRERTPQSLKRKLPHCSTRRIRTIDNLIWFLSLHFNFLLREREKEEKGYSCGNATCENGVECEKPESQKR